jgi:hypothetical protein
MPDVLQILSLSAAVVFALVFLCMAVAGIRTGRVYYESSSPPIHFRSRSVAFVGLCVLYLALATTAGIFVVRLIRQLLATP